MKKFIAGAIFGALISFSMSAYADDLASIVGKQIQGEFPVKINGTSLDKKAAVVDGTSYLPVRAIGDALNMDVSFNADLGIELKPKTQGGVKLSTNDMQEKQKPTPTISKKVQQKFADKTDVYSGEYVFTELDGEQYINIVALSGPYEITWNDPVIKFKKDETVKEITVETSEYVPGCKAFVLDGNTLVKLSELGLKAIVNGDTLVIEKQ